MKPITRLTSAVFQLTPTRTRCDLIIIANDKKEKIASGLLSPFIAHLKTAQDQIAKGGYSISLIPQADSDAAWFTKATLERFVRFVSTPEILERVNTIETEILQIEESIALQRSNETAQNTVEDHQGKHQASCEGNKPLTSTNENKAIVLYKPGEQPPEANGSYSQGGNSKAELLKVLETRKRVLQKEQGMAFARAVAAGFDIDQISPLLSFAECFEALRLMEACSRFMGLWKSKHETGQWLDIEASEELSSRSDFSAMNTSGIILSATPNKLNMPNHELASDGTEQSDQRTNIDNPAPNGQQVHFQGPYPNQMVPTWAMYAPPGAQHIFPIYPVQEMPYYPSYASKSPFFQPPHNPMEHSRSNFGHQPGQKRQSLDGMGNDIGSELCELDRASLLDDMNGASNNKKPRKKAGGSSKMKAGMVVVRNINYITSKVSNSGSESSISVSDNDNGDENLEADGNNMIHRPRSSNSKGSIDGVTKFGKDTDDGHWQVFQNCLLRENHENAHAEDEGMFAMEKNINIKKCTNTVNDDSLAPGALDIDEIQDTRVKDIRKISASMSWRPRRLADDAFLSSTDNNFRGTSDPVDIEFTESNGRKILSRTTQEDAMIGRRHNQINFKRLSDPLAMNSFEVSINEMDRVSHGTADEALIVPFRSMSTDQVGLADRMTIDIESEIQLAHQKLNSEGNKNKFNYEPDDLSLMPERGAEKRSAGYDLALEYEMQVFVAGSQEKRVKNVTDVKRGLKKPDKDMSSKVISGSSYKQRTGGPFRNGRPLKTTPLEDAQARAERLRSYKADLQKLKKEKEEAEAKRLDALKLQRQKRIAARGSSAAAKPAASSPQAKQLPAKLSPANNRGSKFTDAEPGSSSPLQRSKIRTSLGSSELLKASKASKLSEGSKIAGNRLTRSSSSLSEMKKEVSGETPDSKISTARIRRLSEPKTINNASVTSMKARRAETVSKRKSSEGPEGNRVSAIIHLDRSKGAALPELKINISKSHANAGEIKPAVKGVRNVNGIISSTFCDNAVNESKFSRTHVVDVDDNPIAEKTVVMLEYEKPSRINLHSSAEKSGVQTQHFDGHNQGGNSNVTSGLAFAQASASPVDGVGRDPNFVQPQKQLDPNEVRISEKAPSNNATAEKCYQAPYARVSSLKDPCTAKLEYFKTPVARSELVPRVEETVNVHIPDVKTLKLDNPVAAVKKKTHLRESSKGLRRFLKFGKKNCSSLVDQSVDSDCRSVNGIEHEDNARSTASTSEGHMLKNLISQDETSNAGDASQKTSRHFSLFSPFRSKTSEKKIVSS